MPNIKTYDTPNLGLNPTETGVESFAAAARRGGTFFNQGAQSIDEAGRRIGAAQHLLGEGLHAIGGGLREAGDVAVAYADHQQISAGAKTEADMLFGLTEDWNGTAKNADPNDPSTAQKWVEETLEPALRRWQEGFTTERSQQWSEHRVEQLRQHFFEKSSADMSSIAGIAASNNATDVATNYSNLAVRDPSSVDFLLGSVDHAIGGIVDSSPNLKGAAAEKTKLTIADNIKRQIVNGGAFGAIQKSDDPEATAAEWTKKYPDQINGKEALALGKAAKVQARANELQGKALENYQQTQNDRAVKHDANGIWERNVAVDRQTGQRTIKPDFFQEAVKLPGKYPGSDNAVAEAKTLLDWGTAQLEGRKIVSDPTTVDGLDGRMFSTDNPTTTVDILRAEADHKLSHQDAEVRRQLVNARDKEPITNEQFKFAMAGAKELIEGGQILKGEQAGKYASFQQQFLAEYQKEIRNGTLKPNALNLNDENSLVSQMMQQYMSPLQQKIRGNGGVGAPSTFNARFGGEGAPNVIRTTPVAGPGVSATPPVSLPPVKDRVVGKSYQLPSGMFKWTGKHPNGWERIESAAPATLAPGQM